MYLFNVDNLTACRFIQSYYETSQSITRSSWWWDTKAKIKTEKKTNYYFFFFRPTSTSCHVQSDTDRNSFRLQKLRTWGLYLLHMIANKFSETESVQNWNTNIKKHIQVNQGLRCILFLLVLQQNTNFIEKKKKSIVTHFFPKRLALKLLA